jgi:hypothetical protein
MFGSNDASQGSNPISNNSNANSSPATPPPVSPFVSASEQTPATFPADAVSAAPTFNGSTQPLNTFSGNSDNVQTPVVSQVPDLPEPVIAAPIIDDNPVPAPTPAASEPTSDSDDLIDIKQKALNELSPLVDQLDQEPEERFRTVMMMIQAGDNQSLIPEAYTAAHQITDEKERAQALLDVVNEINYFTQKASS